MTAKLTILYERLSHEDGRENESLSIENQKEYLEEYATRNGFTNFIHIADDGWSGTRWDRPGFLQMLEKVESGSVGQILIKDMSRLGRDHLRVGLFLEQLRDMDVRLIAAAEGIDTAKGEDDFMPFRNLFAEWHARDTSRKIRTIFDGRTVAGKRVSGAIPYGYLHDQQDRQKWIVDEEAEPIVQRIFQSVIGGKTVSQIADELSAEGVLTPAAHWTKLGAGMPGKPTANPTRWSATTIINICKKEEYMGWKTLNKTSKESHKSKKREQTAPENEAEFIERVREESELQQENAVRESRKKLAKSKRRREEVSGLVKKLYEAYATDKIPEKHFSELLTSYDTEQAALDNEIEQLQAGIDRYNTDSVRADRFLELVKKHTEFPEFSAPLLNEFVEKIVVHEADKTTGQREQQIDIYLSFIGKFELPELELPQEEAPARKSKKKLRSEMTEEQVARERERDKERYTKKVAAKKAAEQAERAAILQGTAYELPPQETEKRKSA